MMGALRLKCSKDVIIFESVTKSSRARKKFSFIFFPINCLEDTKKKKKKKAINYLEKARATFPECLGARRCTCRGSNNSGRH